MSSARPAFSVHAVHASDDLSTPACFLDCSTCKLPFRTHPLVFGCGHSVCSECADVMRACVPALCLMCQRPIASCLENLGLGDSIQEARDGCSSEYLPPGPRRAKMLMVSQAEGDAGAALLRLLDQSAAASATLRVAAHAVAQAKGTVVSDTLACVDVFNHAVDGLLVQVEEYRRRGLMEVQLLGLEREKALEAQADLLDVSAGQLRACVALGRAAAAGGDDGRVCGAAQTAIDMEGLLAVSAWVCTGTRSAVLFDQLTVLACLKRATRLERFEVNAVRSSASGAGLTALVKGGAARNVIRVICMGNDGELGDVVVEMTVNGAAWQVASAAVPEPGVVEVTYVVEDEGLEEPPGK